MFIPVLATKVSFAMSEINFKKGSAQLKSRSQFIHITQGTIVVFSTAPLLHLRRIVLAASSMARRVPDARKPIEDCEGCEWATDGVALFGRGLGGFIAGVELMIVG